MYKNYQLCSKLGEIYSITFNTLPMAMVLSKNGEKKNKQMVFSK